jgi:hypothetical protein
MRGNFRGHLADWNCRTYPDRYKNYLHLRCIGCCSRHPSIRTCQPRAVHLSIIAGICPKCTSEHQSAPLTAQGTVVEWAREVENARTDRQSHDPSVLKPAPWHCTVTICPGRYITYAHHRSVSASCQCFKLAPMATYARRPNNSRRERERKNWLKSLRFLNLRCNHFINLNIFYFSHEKANIRIPPFKHLKNIKFFTKNIFFTPSLKTLKKYYIISNKIKKYLNCKRLNNY